MIHDHFEEYLVRTTSLESHIIYRKSMKLKNVKENIS